MDTPGTIYRAVAIDNRSRPPLVRHSQAHASEEEAFRDAQHAKKTYPHLTVRIQYSPVPEEGQPAQWFMYA